MLKDLFSSGTPEEELFTKSTKNPKPNKNEKKKTVKNGEICIIPTYRNGCKKSEKILWTQTHTPILLMNYLLELTLARSADLGKCSVEIHFPKDRNCEFCQRTKSRGPRAEDVLAESYQVQKILVV